MDTLRPESAGPGALNRAKEKKDRNTGCTGNEKTLRATKDPARHRGT